MALNWVMLDGTRSHKFIPLPAETTLYASPARTTLSLSANISSGSGNGPPPSPFSLSSKGGVAYLTNQRLIYIPTNPTTQFESFSAPLTSIFDTHVTSPMFGPNVWVGTVQPVLDGNLPSHPRIYDFELKLTFKDGGTFDFHSLFERMRERIQNAIELGEDVNAARDRGLDELPSYERDLPSYESAIPVPIAATTNSPSSIPMGNQPPLPDGPPPGYEEAQMAGLEQGLGNRT